MRHATDHPRECTCSDCLFRDRKPKDLPLDEHDQRTRMGQKPTLTHAPFAALGDRGPRR